MKLSHEQYLKIGKTHHWIPALVFGPLSLLLLGFSKWGGANWGQMFSFWVGGFLAWTVVEYFMHRFFLHWQVTKEPWRIMSSGFHILHHEIPNRQDYVVAPIVMTLPLFFVFGGAFCLLSGGWINGFLISSGLASCFVAYEWMHYQAHHGTSNNRFMKYMKKYHMLHHFNDSENYFGVTTPFWDWVFGTKPDFDEDRPRKTLSIVSRDKA